MKSNSNNGGQSLCNCKKSKCLKLYCACFASGLYCGEHCSCKECFNRPDYEDTVEEMRKQIELRDPSAFSSKILCLVESSTRDNVKDGDQVKPVVGKHRKGCNCRKSMCQKGYCECYQANVGCCDECRCEGCKNKFGKREDYRIFNESIHETAENAMQSTASELDNPYNLTPSTPFQHFGHEKDSSKSGRYIPSAGSADSDMMLGTSTGKFDMVRLDQQAYLNAFMNQFTPPDSSAHFNARRLSSVMNIPPTMDFPNSSTPSGNYSSVRSWPGLLMTPATLFGVPEVMNYNGKPNTGTQLHFTR